MFCIKCGCHIPPNAKKCPDCGEAIANMEYCNGFWQELNQNMPVVTPEEKGSEAHKNQPARRKKEVSPAQKKTVKATKQKKNTSTFKTVLIAESAIVALLLLYTVISGSLYKGRINALQEQIEAQEATIEDLNQDLDVAKENSSALQELVAAQQEEIDGLKQESISEEETYVSEDETNPSEEDILRGDGSYEDNSPEDESQGDDLQRENQQTNVSEEEYSSDGNNRNDMPIGPAPGLEGPDQAAEGGQEE